MSVSKHIFGIAIKKSGLSQSRLSQQQQQQMINKQGLKLISQTLPPTFVLLRLISFAWFDEKCVQISCSYNHLARHLTNMSR